MYFTLHYITLHYITLHYITVKCDSVIIIITFIIIINEPQMRSCSSCLSNKNVSAIFEMSLSSKMDLSS